jgi:hypothetical protein
MLALRSALSLALLTTPALFTAAPLGPAVASSTLTIPAVVTTSPDDFVFDVGPDTKAPLGALVPAEGLLLDPRDLPEPVFAYFEGIEDLEGLEASLTGLFGRGLGLAAERKRLPKRYSQFCEHQTGQWEDLLESIRDRLEVDGAPELVTGAPYHDTGRRVDFAANQLTIVGPPRIREVALASSDLDTLLKMQADVALFGRDMPVEAAKRLQEVALEAATRVDDPWTLHTALLVLWLSLERLDEKHGENPLGMTHDEFLARCKRSLQEVLVDPMFPTLTKDVDDNDVWFLEGLVAPKANWPEPKRLIAQNELVHQPILLVQLKRKREEPDSKLKAVRIATVVGGEVHPLYEGKWPL